MASGSLADTDAKLRLLGARFRQYRDAGLDVSALVMLSAIDRLLDQRLTLMAAS